MHSSLIKQQLIDERPFGWFDSSKLKGMRMDAQVKRLQAAWRIIELHVLTNGAEGCTLSNGGNLFAVITLDCEGGYRYTTFDQDGFIGHGCYVSAAKALRAAFNMGLHHIADRSTLDTLMGRRIRVGELSI